MLTVGTWLRVAAFERFYKEKRVFPFSGESGGGRKNLLCSCMSLYIAVFVILLFIIFCWAPLPPSLPLLKVLANDIRHTRGGIAHKTDREAQGASCDADNDTDDSEGE